MTRFSTVSALALAVVASPGLADVTPGQVWNDFQSYMQGFGYDVSATETMSGDTLTVSDISLVVTIPEEDVTVGVTMPTMTYSANGDGTVSMTLPSEGEMGVAIGPAGAPAEATLTFALTQAGLDVRVSGDENNTNYAYAAESVGLRLLEVIGDGEVFTGDTFRAEMSMGPIQGTSGVTRADGLQRITQQLSYGVMAFDMFFDDPDSSDTGMFSGSWSGLRGTGDMTLPMDADFEDPEAMLEAGLAVDAVLEHAGGNMQFEVNDAGDLVSGATSSQGGSLAVAMSRSQMVYAVNALQQSVQLVVPDMPFPISGTLGQFLVSFELPLQASPVPQPASMAFKVGDLTMADMLWNIFDPGQTLARDPVTVAATVNAEVTPYVSLLDEDQLNALERTGGVPGELNTLRVSDLEVRGVGASITGAGDFTFDNTDLETFGGFPRPIGVADFQLAGINGLIDNLISMGLMQDSDAMGARMGLSMFTVPGNAPDTASAKLEINAQGHILANGQRIQ